MSVRGERFIFGFYGGAPTRFIEEAIAEKGLSGVILFSRNIADAAGLKCICEELQAIGRRASAHPLLILMDHEGGGVHRIAGGVTHFPSPMAVAATGSIELARRVGYCMGIELASCGVNVNLAPVLDVNLERNNPVIGVRSFGDNPGRVASFGEAMIRGLEESGMISVAKHFPGLGRARTDSHKDLPVIDGDIALLEKEEMPPFRKAVEAGVSGIMVGHARYPSLDEKPASLSGRIIRDLIRDELGFDGAVITDDLGMGAVKEWGGARGAAAEAWRAGSDLLLVCHSEEEQKAVLCSASDFFDSGGVGGAECERSLARVRLLRERAGMRPERGQAIDIHDGGELARIVAESAITLVSDREKILPIHPGAAEKVVVFWPVKRSVTAVEDGEWETENLGSIIRRVHPGTEVFFYAAAETDMQIAAAKKKISGAEVAVVATCNAHLSAEQAAFVKELASAGRPTVFVALGNPYDAEIYPPESARIAAYGREPCTLEALRKVIFGEIRPQGVSPVSLKV